MDIARLQQIASSHGWEQVQFNVQSYVMGFKRGNERVNVYYTTWTVGTCVDHPKQGKTQLFRRNQTWADIDAIFRDPRVHTGAGYYRKASRYNEEPSLKPLCWWGTELMSDFDPEDTALVALGHSYFHVDANGWAAYGAGHTVDFVNKLKGRQASLPSVDYVAFGPGDYYFVQFTDGKWQCVGPDGLLEALRRGTRDIGMVDALAFAPGDGWFVQFEDGTYEWLDVPHNLHALLNKRKKKNCVEEISIGPQLEWYVSFDNGDWKCNNVTDGCNERVDIIHRQGGEVKHMAFGTASSWLITYEAGDAKRRRRR